MVKEQGTARPTNMPSNPHLCKLALLYSRSVKRKTHTEWVAWCKSGAQPVHVASRPDRSYTHNVRQGYAQWLGTGNDSGEWYHTQWPRTGVLPRVLVYRSLRA